MISVADSIRPYASVGQRHYCRVSHIETLRILHLSGPGRILRLVTYPGQRLRVELPVRAILADILRLGSKALILTHNHPFGDPTPSPTDVATTRKLAHLLDALNVRLHDHIVIGSAGRISFRDAGLL